MSPVGKRDRSKVPEQSMSGLFGTYFWSPFHLSWFTTAARVTLKKPPSCCQRQWHHCKRWGLCRIVIFVLLPTLISKSRLKFFFLDPVNLKMTVMDLCIGQGWQETSFSPGLWQRSSTDPCGSCWSQCPTKKVGWVPSVNLGLGGVSLLLLVNSNFSRLPREMIPKRYDRILVIRCETRLLGGLLCDLCAHLKGIWIHLFSGHIQCFPFHS